MCVLLITFHPDVPDPPVLFPDVPNVLPGNQTLFFPALRPHTHRTRMLPRPAHIPVLPGIGEADVRPAATSARSRTLAAEINAPGISPFGVYSIVTV